MNDKPLFEHSVQEDPVDDLTFGFDKITIYEREEDTNRKLSINFS